MPTLERSNPLPLYYQLKEVLKQQIRAGHLAPHTAIPSEPELVAQYHVSRATVRQALTELVHEGLLYRQHGRGTFVCEPRVQQRTLSELTSLSDELRQRGKRPGGLLFVSELVRGSQTVRDQLRLTDEEQVVRLERLRTADDTPIAYEVDYLPYPRASSVYQRAKETAEGSLYNIMATEGLHPYIVEHSLKGDLASAREAELLRVPPETSGLRLASTVFDDTGSPIEYTEAFYPGTSYDFRLTLRTR
ncbi:MAG: GntR family transcriptional regulator [Ktedonobacteraceae bacterium]|nr:GntR family transcriptional regulator [Ktedonobacteraceae bacterium]MBV9712342.1 GntR family transcriptional regulator [Ktedonobacteraceae bacterium]